jgi:hypothetical protein
MDQLDYKPNSHKSKEEQKTQDDKKIEKVVKGPVKVKKKNELSKLADVFISEDARNVKSYVLMDVLVPAIKKAISDIVTDGIDMILYGTTGKSGRRRSTADKISYRSYYDRRDDDRRSMNDSGTRTRYSYDEVIIDSRGEAEAVLSRMGEVIDRYGVVSVADFYEMVGEKGEYTDNKYGWNSIRNAEVVRVSGGGYMIRLPRAMAID